MTDDQEPITPPTDPPPDEDDGRGGGDGKSKALGRPGLGDRGRASANEPTDN